MDDLAWLVGFVTKQFLIGFAAACVFWGCFALVRWMRRGK